MRGHPDGGQVSPEAPHGLDLPATVGARHPRQSVRERQLCAGEPPVQLGLAAVETWIQMIDVGLPVTVGAALTADAPKSESRRSFDRMWPARRRSRPAFARTFREVTTAEAAGETGLASEGATS